MRAPLIATLVVILSLSLPTHAAQEEDRIDILIDNEPIRLGSERAVVAAKVFGIRSFGDPNQATAAYISQLKFSRDTILKSALAFEEIRRQLQKTGFKVEKITLGQLKETIKKSGYEEKYLYVPGAPIKGRLAHHKSVNLIEPDFLTEAKFKNLDPTLVVNMIATGVLDIDDIKYIDWHGKKIEVVGFSDDSRRSIHDIYGLQPLIYRKELQELPVTWANVSTAVKNYEPTEKALLLELGDITFGEPEIYTAEEKGLEVPASTRKRNDVYWVELKVTFWDLIERDLEEMAVNFAVQEGIKALHLLPLSYSIEMHEINKLQSPKVEISAKGIKASIGEIYSRTVGYKYLRPVIKAFGEGGGVFAWKFVNEAAQTGSHKLVAILGVPKGTNGLSIAMSAHVRLGKLRLFGGGLAGTEVVTMYLNF